MSKKVVLVVVLVVVTFVIIAKAVSANPAHKELRNRIALIEGSRDIKVLRLNDHSIDGEIANIIGKDIASDILPEFNLIRKGLGSIYDLRLS